MRVRDFDIDDKVECMPMYDTDDFRFSGAIGTIKGVYGGGVYKVEVVTEVILTEGELRRVSNS